MAIFSSIGRLARRDLLRAGFGSVVLGATGLGRSPFFSQAAAAPAPKPGRILVVVELSGGNDGLNTVVPYGDDAYYKARPKIGIRPDKLRKLDDHFGFQNTMAGMERLYKDGHLAIVHGVGYDQPSFSHFASMAYWQTAAPNRGELYGWDVARLGEGVDEGHRTFVVVFVIVRRVGAEGDGRVDDDVVGLGAFFDRRGVDVGFEAGPGLSFSLC